MPVSIQAVTIVLPQVWSLGTETETLNDILEHPSIDIPEEFMQEKQIHLVATEFITAGVPGNLWCWIELSPVASTTSTAYWTAIGGGGGALPPMAPAVLVASGVTGTVHTLSLPWSIHSPFARLVTQVPVAATPLTAFWLVQALISGKGA